MEKLTNNKELVNKFFENFEKANYNEIEKLLGGAFKLNITGFNKPLSREESIHLIQGYKVAFPDIKFTPQLQLEDGEYVVSRMVVTGTHKGEFLGTPATNKKVNATCTVI